MIMYWSCFTNSFQGQDWKDSVPVHRRPREPNEGQQSSGRMLSPCKIAQEWLQLWPNEREMTNAAWRNAVST